MVCLYINVLAYLCMSCSCLRKMQYAELFLRLRHHLHNAKRARPFGSCSFGLLGGAVCGLLSACLWRCGYWALSSSSSTKSTYSPSSLPNIFWFDCSGVRWSITPSPLPLSVLRLVRWALPPRSWSMTLLTRTHRPTPITMMAMMPTMKMKAMSLRSIIAA